MAILRIWQLKTFPWYNVRTSWYSFVGNAWRYVIGDIIQWDIWNYVRFIWVFDRLGRHWWFADGFLLKIRTIGGIWAWCVWYSGWNSAWFMLLPRWLVGLVHFWEKVDTKWKIIITFWIGWIITLSILAFIVIFIVVFIFIINAYVQNYSQIRFYWIKTRFS